MEDLINRAIEFARENDYDLYLPRGEHGDEEINTIRIVSKEKAVYFEIE